MFADFDLVAVLKIIWIDILLSGDNAMVIALACKELPANKRRWGVILGAGAAVSMRIAFTFGVTQALGIPYLRLVGSLLLLWIAVKLVVEDTDEVEVQQGASIWKAVWTILVADAVMSLDNVIAIALAADGHFGLVIFGLVLSIPLVIFGSTLIMALMDRWPVFIWAGAALLGWISGSMIASDPAIAKYLPDAVWSKLGLEIAFAALVCAVGWIVNRRADNRESAA